MRDVVQAMSAAVVNIAWPRFVTSLVFCLTLTAIKVASNWSGMARDITAVLLFVGASFLIEFAHSDYLNRHGRSKCNCEEGRQHQYGG
jgi:hypothetical protein